MGHQLSNVVDHGEQFPLCVDLHPPPKCEAVETQVAPNVCEHRFHGAHTTAVVVATAVCVESIDHPLDR